MTRARDTDVAAGTTPPDAELERAMAAAEKALKEGQTAVIGWQLARERALLRADALIAIIDLCTNEPNAVEAATRAVDIAQDALKATAWKVAKPRA